MFIKEIKIKKFRGFHDVSFELGTHLTVLAGQNGTQKTTLLGMLTQPFSITDKENPIYGEKPLCGGNFKSAFAEKFKLSESFDKPKEHEWTLSLNIKEQEEITLESISRGQSSTTHGNIRFWRKGNREKGSGYIQLPVIYLSLSRLLPIGEDKNLSIKEDVSLSKEEFDFIQREHNKILLLPSFKMEKADYLSSTQKRTLGVTTDYYDWKMNSAGQDNISKILLAILSFKRLKEKYPNFYTGGILAIDELDATLYPASQINLLKELRHFSANLKIQTIFTTHSLTILKEIDKLENPKRGNNSIKTIFLEQKDKKINAYDNLFYDSICHRLNVTMGNSKTTCKVPVFTEDKEAKAFLRAIVKRKFKLEYLNCTLGCGNLKELARKKITGFKASDSIIVLDGDAGQIGQYKNIIKLPGNDSPEKTLATFLFSLSDSSQVWKSCGEDYSKQFCFKEYDLVDIQDRVKAKAWFQSQQEYWGTNCCKIINPWIKSHKPETQEFIDQFGKLYDALSKQLALKL